MRLAIIGGKLQGTEAVYLAEKAGYRTVLVDRRPLPPAAGLADEVHVLDLLEDEKCARRLLESCDAVLPACENLHTLSWLSERLPGWGIPLLFDQEAYRLSSSKLRSDQLFAELDVPRPRSWPCAFPVIVKPSGSSGSEGVRLARGDAELGQARRELEDAGHEVVVQEFVRGPSLSLEVLGWEGRQRALLATGLEFDAGYDCKRVTAPVAAGPQAVASLNQAGLSIARGLRLQGLTDVEVMLADEEPKVIEIDARLPSQTPTVVYQASGVNIVALLAEAALGGKLPEGECEARAGVVYQHVLASGGRLEVLGEHVMGAAGPLRLESGFFGSHEALTDFEPGAPRWVATLILREQTLADARAAAASVVERIGHDLGLELVPESEPAGWEAAG